MDVVSLKGRSAQSWHGPCSAPEGQKAASRLSGRNVLVHKRSAIPLPPLRGGREVTAIALLFSCIRCRKIAFLGAKGPFLLQNICKNALLRSICAALRWSLCGTLFCKCRKRWGLPLWLYRSSTCGRPNDFRFSFARCRTYKRSDSLA